MSAGACPSLFVVAVALALLAALPVAREANESLDSESASTAMVESSLASNIGTLGQLRRSAHLEISQILRMETNVSTIAAPSATAPGPSLGSWYVVLLLAAWIGRAAIESIVVERESWQRVYADYMMGYVFFIGVVIFVANCLGPDWGWAAVGFLIFYAGIYAVCVLKFHWGEPRRVQADRFMCCWSDLYLGRAFLPYTVLFSPFLLVFHSLRIHFFTCLTIYAHRIYWLVFASFHEYYEDHEFPPNSSSLGNVTGDTANKASGRTDADVIWVRASDFMRENINDRPVKPTPCSSHMNLFDGKIEPNDVRQGALGDCWLLAAMACMAEIPGRINSIFITKELDPRGKYKVRLFDPGDNKWKVVIVDDYIPCKRSNYSKDGVARGQDGKPITLYARPNGNEIWSLILEKAVAKLCGSYHAIEGGFTEWGLVCFTGNPAWRYDFVKKGDKYEFDCLKLKMEAKVEMKAWRDVEGEQNEGDFFALLQYFCRNGALTCCSGVKAEGEKLGLVSGHAYSILDATQCTVSLASPEYFRFVQIRNPWGDGEWTGSWSDESEKWNSHKYVAQSLGFEKSNDGSFWMQWEDFCQYWSNVGVVDCSLDITSVHLPPYDTKRADGPLRGCGWGCLDYWVRCVGPFRFFFNHKASSEKISRELTHDWGGCDPSGFYFRLFDTKPVSVRPTKE